MTKLSKPLSDKNIYENETKKLSELNKKGLIILILIKNAKDCLKLLRTFKGQIKSKVDETGNPEYKQVLANYQEEDDLTVEQITRFEKEYEKLLIVIKQQTDVVSKLKSE